MGDKTFIGPSKTIDTNKKITVVTQFITNDGTVTGDLVEIRRLYVQNGRVYSNSPSLIPGVFGNSLTEGFCSSQKKIFGDTNSFASKGGLKKMSQSLNNGMVLALSVLDDYATNMLWLDSTYPPDKDTSQPGVVRGPCERDSSLPHPVEGEHADGIVTFSNIKYGDIGTTYSGIHVCM